MRSTTLLLLPLLLLGMLAASCNQQDENKAGGTQETYDNPFEYCKAVENIDAPGPQYAGTKVPEVIAEKLKKEFGAPDSTPIDTFVNGTFWRCMDGSVYACNVGANLPCQERGDFSKEPNSGMLNYCGENPDSDFIPMYASGRATVYEWKCDNGTPEIVKQIAETDKAGYIKNIWYKITP